MSRTETNGMIQRPSMEVRTTEDGYDDGRTSDIDKMNRWAGQSPGAVAAGDCASSPTHRHDDARRNGLEGSTPPDGRASKAGIRRCSRRCSQEVTVAACLIPKKLMPACAGIRFPPKIAIRTSIAHPGRPGVAPPSSLLHRSRRCRCRPPALGSWSSLGYRTR